MLIFMDLGLRFAFAFQGGWPLFPPSPLICCVSQAVYCSLPSYFWHWDIFVVVYEEMCGTFNNISAILNGLVAFSNQLLQIHDFVICHRSLHKLHCCERFRMESVDQVFAVEWNIVQCCSPCLREHIFCLWFMFRVLPSRFHRFIVACVSNLEHLARTCLLESWWVFDLVQWA